MSDTKPQDGDAKEVAAAPAAASFEPSAAPPVIEAAPAAAEPVAPKRSPNTPSASVDERAYRQYQALSEVVLDSAEVASKSAEAAVEVGEHMRKTAMSLQEILSAGQKRNQLMFYIAGGFMVVCSFIFLVIGVRMVSRINQLDTMMMAVGKRVVELNAGLQSLDAVNQKVQDLSDQQVALTKAQGQIETRIDASLKQSESLVNSVPSETAKQVAATSNNLIQQVQGINSRLQTQANAVTTLGNEVKSLKGAVGGVENLKRDVEALVTLQKERVLETLQKNNAAASREKALQYPRVNPPAPAGAAAPARAASQ
ncbi:MAG: hypothetical protein RI949_1333 [Pseudomonadota bacterium]|jgi:hypothetical protein